MSVIQEIAAERGKQVAKGFTAEHDDEHRDGRLADVAIGLLQGREDDWGITDRNVGDRRKLRIIAIALLVAETERMDRLERKAAAS